MLFAINAGTPGVRFHGRQGLKGAAAQPKQSKCTWVPQALLRASFSCPAQTSVTQERSRSD